MNTFASLLLVLQLLIPATGYEVLGDGTLRADNDFGMYSACVHELSGQQALDCLTAAVSF